MSTRVLGIELVADDKASVAFKEASASAVQFGKTVDEAATKNVQRLAEQREKLAALAAEYRQVAASATAGSREQAAALDLAAKAEARLAASSSAANTQLVAATRSTKEHASALKSYGSAFLGFAGFVGAADAIRGTVDATESLVAQQGQLAQAARNTGTALDTKQLDAWIERESRLATITKGDVTASLTSFVRATGDQAKAEKDAALAADISRGAHMDLATVTKTLTSLEEGRTARIQQLGIQIPIVKTAEEALTESGKKFTASEHARAAAMDRSAAAQEALRELTAKYSGDAVRYSTSTASGTDKLRVAVNTLETSVGTALLPAVEKLAAPFAEWAQKEADSGDAAQQASAAVHDLVGALTLGKDAVHGLDKVTGGLKDTLEILIGLKIARTVNAWATEFGLTGLAGSEASAATEASVLSGRLAGLAKIGSIAIGVDLLIRAHGSKGAIGIAESIAGGALVGGAAAGPIGAVIGGTAAGIAETLSAASAADGGAAGFQKQLTADQQAALAARYPTLSAGMSGQQINDALGNLLAAGRQGTPEYAALAAFAKAGHVTAAQAASFNAKYGLPALTPSVTGGSGEHGALLGRGSDTTTKPKVVDSKDNEIHDLQAEIARLIAQGTAKPGKKGAAAPLLGADLADAVSKYADLAKNLGNTGAKAKADLEDELAALKREQEHLQGMKQTDAVKKALTGVEDKIRDVQTEIAHAIVRTGAALLPASLKSRLSAETAKFAAESDYAAVLTGDTATAYGKVLLGNLTGQRETLEKEEASLKAQLASASGKQKAAIETELASVKSQLSSVNQQIISNLQANVQALQSKVGTLFSSVESELDTALGNLYFQNGLLTPAESQLAAMQAQDTADSLNDALAAAKKQLATDTTGALVQTIVDQATGTVKNIYGPSGSADQLAADQAAIDQAQRAIDENNLQIEATKERTQADTTYTSKVQDLNAQIDALAGKVEDGTGSIGDLSTIASTFGLTITTDTIPDFADLSTASGDLKKAFGDLATYIASITGVTPPAPVDTSSGGGGDQGAGGAGDQGAKQATISVGTSTYAVLPSGTLALLSGSPADAIALGARTHIPIAMGDGGYVPPTPGGSLRLLAERGEGEFVVPESKMRAAVGGGGGGVIVNVTVSAPHFVGDYRDLAKAITSPQMRSEIVAAIRGATYGGNLKTADLPTS